MMEKDQSPYRIGIGVIVSYVSTVMLVDYLLERGYGALATFMMAMSVSIAIQFVMDVLLVFIAHRWGIETDD